MWVDADMVFMDMGMRLEMIAADHPSAHILVSAEHAGRDKSNNKPFIWIFEISLLSGAKEARHSLTVVQWLSKTRTGAATFWLSGKDQQHFRYFWFVRLDFVGIDSGGRLLIESFTATKNSLICYTKPERWISKRRTLLPVLGFKVRDESW